MNEDDEHEPLGAQAVQDMQRAELEEARRDYNDIVNRLWAGNGAGLIASLTLVVQAINKSHATPSWGMFSPAAFMLAILALGLGGLVRLVTLARRVKDLQSARDILEVPIRTILHPLDRAELTWWSPRSLSALVATGMFMLGTVIGVLAIFVAVVRT
ncbi:hypothetical protein [Phenylobacterium sp.]|uniref:hypothetical protein n=1 Tax=Phenylobacterium sp. TaxID=1871053 RepID=UPI003D2A33AB